MLNNYQSIPVDIHKKKYDEKREQFTAHLNHQFQDAESSREERVQDWRQAWDYYRRQQPVFKDRQFVLDYIEPVLQDAVDSIMPSMLNVFCENDDMAVCFRPRSKFNASGLPVSQVAEAVNNEINDIFLRQNSGYKQLYDAILEALVTGDVYGKVYAEEHIIEETAVIDEYVPAVLLESILKEFPDTDLSQFKTRTKEGADEFKTDGEAFLTRNETKIKYDYVPFGELYVDAICTDIESARYVSQRIPCTKGELLERFPDMEEAIVSANPINSLSESQTSLAKMETLKTTASKDDYFTSYVDDLEVDVYLYEHYIYSSILEGKTKLYQVFTVDGEATELLEVNEVGCHPFIKGEVQPLPDSFWGISLHSMLKDEQDLLTWITLEIAENATRNNRPHWLATGNVFNGEAKRSLMDYRAGGVTFLDAPASGGHIVPMPQTPLSATTESLYQKIKDSVEASKGNAMSLDMNGALNNAAASTVAMAVQNAEMQDKKFSKAFALSYMKPLFDKIYKLMKVEKIDIEHEGEVISAANLPSNYEFTIDVNTSNDGARIAGQLANIAQMEAQLSQADSPLMGAQERYNIYESMLEATGVPIDSYFLNPADHEPSPEEIAKQKELEEGQAEMMRMEKLSKEIQVRKEALEVAELESKILNANRETELKAIETQHKISKDNEELTLEEAKASTDAALKQVEVDTSLMIAEADIALSQSMSNPHVNISH